MDLRKKALAGIEELFDKFVPATGMCDTVGGELVRAYCRLHYRAYNDGDMPGEGYGNQTCNSSYRYIFNCSELKNYMGQNMILYPERCNSYNDWIKQLDNFAVYFYRFLETDGKPLFEKSNDVDSRTPSDEDIRDAMEEEWEENDDDWDDEYYDDGYFENWEDDEDI